MEGARKEKVMFVDDNANLLAGIRRQLRKSFDVHTAEGGKPGLEMIDSDGPFAVIVCDMKMPDMNGIQFFTKSTQIAPDSVRIMLTGNADLETAMHAVNEGNIFRFLMKPCQQKTLEWAVESGIEYHRLIISERELLEKTLQGSVRALTDMLALVSPTAFGKASRVRGYMRQLADALSVPDRWMYELAGSLSQIGCVTIPSDTLEKVFAGEKLSDEEEEMYANHSKVAEDLLSDIPRMEAVARIIGRQSQSVETVCESETEPPGFVDMGAQSLALAVEFDTLTSRGLSRNEAVTRIKKRPGRKYNDQALDALSRIQAGEIEVQTRMVRVQDLASLMILAEDVYTTSGMLIAPKGQEATLSVRALLSNYAIRKDIDSEVRVQLSTRVSADAAQDEDIVATQPEAASGQ